MTEKADTLELRERKASESVRARIAPRSRAAVKTGVESYSAARGAAGPAGAAVAAPSVDPEVDSAGYRWTAALRRCGAVVPGLVAGLLMLYVGLNGATVAILGWDEVATVDVARRTPGQIWHLITNVDAVIGAYYFFMHGWTGIFGTSTMVIRLPSIIAMAIAVGLTAELGRRLFTPLVGLVAGLVMCLLPATTRYAQEARPYGISCLLAVLSTLLLYRALQRPGRRIWIGYALTLAALGASHFVALTIVGGHAVAVAFQLRRPGRRRDVLHWFVAVAAATGALVPLAALGSGQHGAQLFWVPPLTPEVLMTAPEAIVGSARTGWLLLGLVLAAGWVSGRRLVEVLAMVVVPLAAVAVVSLAVFPVWVPRYLLVVITPLAVLAAAGMVGSARGRWLPAGAAAAGGGRRGSGWSGVFRAALVLALLWSTAQVAQQKLRSPLSHNGADYVSIATIIRGGHLPGDVIVFSDANRDLRPGLDYYWPQDEEQPHDVLVSRDRVAAGDLFAREFSAQAAHLGSPQRIWLVAEGHPGSFAAKPQLQIRLALDYRKVQRWGLKWATVVLFERRTPR